MAAMDAQHPRRVIEVNRQIVGPAAPRLKTVRPRKLSDYPHVAAVYLDVARRLSSPLRMGPPICDELMALVQHLFTEEEAGVVRHLGLYQGPPRRGVARAEHRPLEQIEPILRRLADEKRVIAASGPAEDRQYRLPPIVPGIFEMMLIGYTPETMTDWHRRFVELFEALYDTGYILDYDGRPTPFVRFLPVGKAIEAHPAALPSDKLEVVLDQFETFGIGQCQCRMAMQVLGQGCGKPLGNCTVMGQWAERGIEDGVLQPRLQERGPRNQTRGRIARTGQLDHERAIDQGPVLLLVLRLLLPRDADGQRVQRAGRDCAAALPPPPRPGQVRLVRQVRQELPDGRDRRGPAARRRTRHLRERCIGCGLCVLACDRQRRPDDGAGPRLPPSLSQLVLADRPRRPRLADVLLEGLAAAARVNWAIDSFCCGRLV